MQQAQDVAAADQSAPRVPEAAAAAVAAMPVAGCPPRRMFCLHISQDGRTVELRPYIFLGPPGPQANGHAASSSSSAPAPVSAVTAPPVAASSGTAHEPELRRLTTAEIDAHEESYFQADDAAIDRADCWDRLLTSTGSGPSRRAAPLRRKEFEHGFTPPPSFPARSRWPLMIGKLLRRHGYWVDFEGRLGSKTSKGSKSTAVISVRQAKRWEERHQAYGERDARWEARKEELFALRQARRARREAAKKAAREECDSRVRKVKREAFWHWEGWHHEEFRDWDDDWHPIGGPIDLSHPPGITRNEAMAARLGLDAGTFNALQELQQRDIRPEDYDLLGRLDETVKKATLDGCKLRIFPTEVFEAASSAQADAQGPSCGVCLVDFQEGEELRVLLPCRHRFHKDCIDYWLLERATTCPMCVTDLKEIIEEADKDKDQEGCASQSDPASSQGHAAEADHELLAMMQCEPLLAMGFSLEQAMAAVLRTGGNVEAAVNLLLEQDAA